MSHESKSQMITGKIIVEGILQFKSPVMVGSGEKDQGVDKIVCKDHNGVPYIPSTSVTGALRHHFFHAVDLAQNNGKHNQQIAYFWGTLDNNSTEHCQSAFIISDLKPVDEHLKVIVRDGIQIHQQQGTAKDKKKYDYEVVEAGASFQFHMEVTLREVYDEIFFQDMTSYLIDCLEQSKIPLGGMTMKGFGRCQLIENTAYILDFSDCADVYAWLGRNAEISNLKLLPSYSSEILLIKPEILPMKPQNLFYLRASFIIKNSLNIRLYSSDPKQPDSVHLKSGHSPVLSGTSLKGAIRSRATKIMNTFNPGAYAESMKPTMQEPSYGEENLKHLFGWVDEEGSGKGKTEKAQKSRLKVEEHLIHNSKEYEQYRIQVDRFTGGTIRGALFDSQPVWPDPENAKSEEMVILEMDIKDCDEWEAGLIMLVLRDLWTGDLPVGGEKGIGRGVFEGVEVKVCYKENQFKLIAELDGGLNMDGEVSLIEKWVQTLNHKFSEEAAHA